MGLIGRDRKIWPKTLCLSCYNIVVPCTFKSTQFSCDSLPFSLSRRLRNITIRLDGPAASFPPAGFIGMVLHSSYSRSDFYDLILLSLPPPIQTIKIIMTSSFALSSFALFLFFTHCWPHLWFPWSKFIPIFSLRVERDSQIVFGMKSTPSPSLWCLEYILFSHLLDTCVSWSCQVTRSIPTSLLGGRVFWWRRCNSR